LSTLKLIVCCDAFLPADQEGGPPFSTFNLCHALGEAGAEVRVVTTDRNGTGRLDVPTDRWTTYEAIPVWYARSLGGPYYPAPSARHVLGSARDAGCLLASGTLWTHLGLLGWRACRRFGTPGIVLPRGLLDPWALNYKAGRKRLYWSLIGRRIVADAAAVVGLTEHERATIQATGAAGRVEVIPNGIRVSDFSNPVPREQLDQWLPQLQHRRFVLFLGRVHEKKGLPALVASLGQPNLAGDDCLLVIAGPVDPDYRGTFDRILESCRHRARLVLTGPVAGERKAALLAHAAAFVLPSLSEGLPVAALEALASGCPTILTPDCHLPEVAAAGAGVEVTSDATAIAGAIGRMLSDSAFARELGQRGVKLARERFDWRAVGGRLLSLCRSVADAR
jgi:glycosyltransferase involved in cell wall biosynthesis